MGIAMMAFSQVVGGSGLKDFISGILSGVSFGKMLVGAYVIGKSLSGR